MASFKVSLTILSLYSTLVKGNFVNSLRKKTVGQREHNLVLR